MELSGIGDYLEIYRKRLFSAEDQKNVIIQAIQRVSGVIINEDDVVIKKSVVIIKTDSVTRNQLFIYKQKILEEIQKTSSRFISDVS